MRNTAKAATERWLTASGIATLSRRRRRGDTLVLAYHNVVPSGEPVAGDRSLHLPEASFGAQLDLLARTHDVVPIQEVLRLSERPLRRPRAVITFDDGYRGALTAGVRQLAARGLPATFFVVPGRMAGSPFWWDALAPEEGPALPAGLRARALEECRGEEDRIRDTLPPAGSPALPAHAAPGSEEEVRAAAATPGITLGSHTWSHPNLARLARDEVERELARSLRWLRERFDPVVPWLSYPYGTFSPGVRTAAAAAGYHAALRIDGGWIRGGRFERYAVPRLNVASGLSAEGFALRLSGLLCR